MRHARRGGRGSAEFPTSGEDSFVAVVVTKLTGALLFILLLTMVIMALIPRAVEVNLGTEAERTPSGDFHALIPVAGSLAEVKPGQTEPLVAPLRILTPEHLPDPVVGRPYMLALAAEGGRGPLRWSLEGRLPSGLSFDRESARIQGTPDSRSATAALLKIKVADEAEQVSRSVRIQTLEAGRPLRPLALRSWLEHGFGYLLLLLVWLLGLNVVGSLERWTAARRADGSAPVGSHAARFWVYRALVSLVAIGSVGTLAAWLLRTTS
jgi:hypothetical protein